MRHPAATLRPSPGPCRCWKLCQQARSQIARGMSQHGAPPRCCTAIRAGGRARCWRGPRSMADGRRWCAGLTAMIFRETGIRMVSAPFWRQPMPPEPLWKPEVRAGSPVGAVLLPDLVQAPPPSSRISSSPIPIATARAAIGPAILSTLSTRSMAWRKRPRSWSAFSVAVCSSRVPDCRPASWSGASPRVGAI